MKEYYYDQLLNIKTCGLEKDSSFSVHYYRYEPTPYIALEALFREYEIKESDRIIDFGCGKGRLNFYIHYFFQTTVIGIEMNERFYQEAMNNLKKYGKKFKLANEKKIQFYRCLAEEYDIQSNDNHFYFFNPFSVQIFIGVIINIILSWQEFRRKVEVILYYPSEDYIFFLDQYTGFTLTKEIVVPELYEKNCNERFLIYKLE